MSDYCLIVIKTSRGNCVLSSMQRLAGATLLVFANKQDLPGALSKEAIREVRLSINLHYMVIADLSSCQITVVVYQWQTQCVCFLQALALDKIKTHHWCIIGCSAVTGENLLDGVDWLLDDIAARIFTADWACHCCFSCGELTWFQAHHWTEGSYNPTTVLFHLLQWVTCRDQYCLITAVTPAFM